MFEHGLLNRLVNVGHPHDALMSRSSFLHAQVPEDKWQIAFARHWLSEVWTTFCMQLLTAWEWQVHDCCLAVV